MQTKKFSDIISHKFSESHVLKTKRGDSEYVLTVEIIDNPMNSPRQKVVTLIEGMGRPNKKTLIFQDSLPQTMEAIADLLKAAAQLAK